MGDDTNPALAEPSGGVVDEHDALVILIDGLVRSGQIVEAARAAATADPHDSRYRAALDRLRTDGFEEGVQALALAVRVPGVLEYDDQSTARAVVLSAAWLAFAGLVVGITTWPRSAPVVAAVLLSATLLAAVSRFPRRSMHLAALTFGAVLVTAAVVVATDATVMEAAVGVTFYGALLVSITWRAARLVAVRGWERRQLMWLRTSGLTDDEVSLVRGLHDQALYGVAMASSMAVARGAAAVVIAWLMAVGVTAIALVHGASGGLVGLLVSFFVTFALLMTMTQLDMVRMWRNPHFARAGHTDRRAEGGVELRSALAPGTLPLVVPRPRQGPMRALGAVLFVVTAASIPAGWPSVVVGLAAAAIAALLWRRYSGTYVRIDENGVTDRWPLGTRHLAWSVIVEISLAAGSESPGVRVTTNNGETRHLIDESRVGELTAALIADAGRSHARAVLRPHAGARRRLRLLGTGSLACVALALFALVLGAFFGEMRQHIDPTTVPSERQIWVDATGHPFVECPSPAAVLAGADTELCAGALRGQLIGGAMFVVLLAAVIWAVTRVRPGRLKGPSQPVRDVTTCA